MTKFTYTLSAADVMLLRENAPRVVTPTGWPRGVAPCAIYIPADHSFALIHNGYLQTRCPRIEPLAALMQGERQEREYIHRILSAEEPCDLASLAPSDRDSALSRAAEERAKRDLYTAAQTAAAVRRAAIIPPTAAEIAALDLDDLLS